MKTKMLLVCFLFFILIFSFNSVFAENFSDLNREINENDYIDLNHDIVLNQNTSDEAEIYSQGISIKNRQISIDGNNHTICARDSDENSVKLFNIFNSNVTLSNMIITSAGFNGNGGAISIDNTSSLILNNITFKDNFACGIFAEGGVIHSKGTLYINGSIFENNYASGAGGAIFSENSNCTIHSSKFINNTAHWYGGAVASDNLLDVTSSAFEGNVAYGGGAVYFTVSDISWDSQAYAALYNSNFTDNTADFGAAIYSSSIKPVIMVNSNFVKNRAYKGGVLCKRSMSTCYIYYSLFDENSAETGAVFYDDSVEKLDEDVTTSVYESIFTNNAASDKGSLYYGRSSLLCVNQSVFYNNTDKVIYDVRGNITVLNSLISNNETDFITQLSGGTLIIANNTWNLKNPGSVSYNNADIDLTSILKNNDYNISKISGLSENDCCSVYVRLNQSDFAISQRRDGGRYNLTVFIDKNQDCIMEFKTIQAYFFLSKVYTNGWAIGTGGWQGPYGCEKIEAISWDMVRNENINQESLELILETFKIGGAGHLLIVAPNGTYGNAIIHSGKDFIKIGVLGDGDYIVSPNGPDYRREGHLDNITDVVYSNMNLSANDWYGVSRHEVVVHHVNLNERGFSDAIYAANDDGSSVNRSDAHLCDEIWFGEESTPTYDLAITPERKYLGTFYHLNKTVFSQNASEIYGSDYDYSVQLFNVNGEFLKNTAVDITVNGKTNEYVTNNDGIITIPFSNLITSKIISLTNPISGEAVTNAIHVLPTLIGDNLVKYYKNESQFVISLIDSSGKPVAGENIAMILNGKCYNRLTNESGAARLNINLGPGNYSIKAFDPLTGLVMSYNITVLSTLMGNNLVKYFKNESQFYISLTDGEGRPASNINITMNINGVFYKRTTDENGTARLNINLSPGEYRLTASDPLTGLMMSYNITVLSVLTADDLNMTFLDGSQFKAKLVDGEGNAFEGENVTFNINGVFYNRLTDANGQAKLNIRLMPGEYIITSRYGSAVTSNKITVLSKEIQI